MLVRVPQDEQGEKRTEERREEGEQQHYQRDHDQVGDIVGQVWNVDPRPVLAGGPAAVNIKVRTA